jgi:transcriptional regulator with XRE-family HTH domain
MNIATYLRQHELTAAEFARNIGVSKSAMARWLSGKRFPRREMIVRISEATGGQVTANDILSQTSEAP